MPHHGNPLLSKIVSIVDSRMSMPLENLAPSGVVEMLSHFIGGGARYESFGRHRRRLSSRRRKSVEGGPDGDGIHITRHIKRQEGSSLRLS